MTLQGIFQTPGFLQLLGVLFWLLKNSAFMPGTQGYKSMPLCWTKCQKQRAARAAGPRRSPARPGGGAGGPPAARLREEGEVPGGPVSARCAELRAQRSTDTKPNCSRSSRGRPIPRPACRDTQLRAGPMACFGCGEFEVLVGYPGGTVWLGGFCCSTLGNSVNLSVPQDLICNMEIILVPPPRRLLGQD